MSEYAFNPLTGKLDRIGSGGGGGDGGDILLTKYETPGNFTWTKNANTASISIYGWAGGSGGGGGGTSDVNNFYAGGGSGASGAGAFYYEMLATSVGATENVVVGAGGAGGAGALGNDATGASGSKGQATLFASLSTIDEGAIPNFSTSSFGLGGGPGSNYGGGSGQPIISVGSATVLNCTGGSAASSVNATAGAGAPFTSFFSDERTSYLCNSGGGGGGAVADATTLSLPANGGSMLRFNDASVLLAGGIAAAVPGGIGGTGQNGGNSGTGGIIFSGTGGGGGASSLSANGGNGGNGGGYGAGGGGGAGAINGFSAGSGGSGGSGAVWVVEHLKS